MCCGSVGVALEGQTCELWGELGGPSGLARIHHTEDAQSPGCAPWLSLGQKEGTVLIWHRAILREGQAVCPAPMSTPQEEHADLEHFPLGEDSQQHRAR